MASLSARAAPVSGARALPAVFGPLLASATVIALLGVAVIVALLPPVLHPLLDLARSAAWLGVAPAEAHRLSDASVGGLLFAGHDFTFAGPDGSPFYDPAEIAHLRDARLVLWLWLALAGGGAALVLAALIRGPRADAWRGIRRGAAALGVVIVGLGIVALVAFRPAFELFHRLAFPGGNWAFDPTTQRLVQLYPMAFWQMVSGLVGVVAAVLAAAIWLPARRRSRAPGAPGAVA